MAESMLKTALAEAGITDVELLSRAITDGEAGNGIDPRAEATLRAHGLSADGHVAAQLDLAELAAMDLVLAMDLEHFDELLDLLSTVDQEHRPQLRMLRSFDPAASTQPHDKQGIYDPWFGDAGDFRETWKMISATLPTLVDYVRSSIASRGNNR